MRLTLLHILTLLLALPLAAQQPCDPGDRWCAEVAALASRPDVAAALRHVEAERDALNREHIQLTEVPAPPFGEQERARVFAEWLRGAGADSVWIDEEGNVLALRRGEHGERTVAVAGHLDTVFPEGTDVTVRQRADTLFAPGIGDDTRGLIVLLGVLRALEAAGVETAADLLFVGTVGEEGLGDLRGVKHLFREGGPRIDAFVAVDGGGDARIVNQALGSRRYRVTFRGHGGHSWGDFGAANPAHALGRAIGMFDEIADAFTSDGPRTSYNVGRIGGGTSINSVPFEAWMEVDMRSEDQSRLLRIDSIFRATMRAALEEQNARVRVGPGLDVDVELVGDRPSGAVPESSPLVQRAMAVTRHFGQEPSLARSSTDSNIPIARGVPAVTIGRGGEGGDAHAPSEWWIDRDGHVAIQRTLLLLLAEAGLAGSRR